MNQSLPAFDVGDHFSEMSNSLSKQFGSFALIALVVAAIHVALTYTFGETSPRVNVPNSPPASNGMLRRLGKVSDLQVAQ